MPRSIAAATIRTTAGFRASARVARSCARKSRRATLPISPTPRRNAHTNTDMISAGTVYAAITPRHEPPSAASSRVAAIGPTRLPRFAPKPCMDMANPRLSANICDKDAADGRCQSAPGMDTSGASSARNA